MDHSKQTGLVPVEDFTPTIEFTLNTEPVDEIPTAPHESPVEEPIPLRKHHFFKRFCIGCLTGFGISAALLCLGHAISTLPLHRDSLPAFLLSVISLGEVQTMPVGISYHPVTTADAPSLPLNAILPPETDDKEEKEPIPSPEATPSPLTFTNETPYTLSDALTGRERVIPPLADLQDAYGINAPVVLILSTHATEAYADHADEGYRTTDDKENMVQVAQTVTKVLEEHGIGVIHCKTRFDEEDFTLAYYNASLSIRGMLKEYPSIQYIVDIHRDSVTDTAGNSLPMEVGDYAQLMFVSGTDHGGSGHSGWADNLSLAVRLHSALEERQPGIMRAVNVRSASFNQQYRPGSLLLEVGSCGGSLEKAISSAVLFGEALADEIVG